MTLELDNEELDFLDVLCCLNVSKLLYVESLEVNSAMTLCQ